MTTTDLARIIDDSDVVEIDDSRVYILSYLGSDFFNPCTLSSIKRNTSHHLTPTMLCLANPRLFGKLDTRIKKSRK